MVIQLNYERKVGKDESDDEDRPLVFNLIGQFFIKDLSMPKGLRNLGLIIVGYTIGSTFSYELFTAIGYIKLAMYLG
ncbi:hypothetical protein RhiirA1_483226 [Rhizophagus irregularis]|uniref:Uncharacterized protein n=1 Tax=Rhizophagus irregularis TaxID=588596 RepID=A0A2N0QKT4_9GLOM|nr:hypothetical protein RhiirA1_483226 [Rhizophagus irregularis]